MTDFQYLYLVLVLIYLSECFFWVRRGSLILVGPERKHYRVRFPSPSVGNEKGGVVFLGVFPPAGGAFVCASIPFSVSSQAVAGISPQALDPVIAHHEPAVFQFDAIRSIRSHEDEVRVDDALLCRCADAHNADGYAKLLQKLKSKKPAERGRAIDLALSRMTDAGQIAGRMEEYERRSRWLRAGCQLMFMLIFFVPAMGMLLPGIFTRWPIFVGVGLCCDLWIATAFYLAHRRLYPQARAARWKSLAIMLLAPTAAVRACHALSRDLLQPYDALACAAILCGEVDFRPFARRVLMDLSHPHPSRQVGISREARDAFAARLAQTYESVLSTAGVNAKELVAPPTPRDAASVSYCPRCDAEFMVTTGTCDDCGGVTLLPLTVAGSESNDN